MIELRPRDRMLRQPASAPARCRRRAKPLAMIGLIGLLVCSARAAQPVRMVVIGDSLSAEYDSITGFTSIAGVEDPTEYAAITVPGWESMSWVEVLGRLRPGVIDFGQTKNTFPGWTDLSNPLQIDLRFTGYEYNFAVPGFTAAQFEQVVDSSLFSDPQLLYYRQQLAAVLQNQADAAVVWLGANEIRANYGFLYDGNDPTSLINTLSNNLVKVVDFVRAEKPGIQLLMVNLPDLGATPAKQAGQPDPLKRANATAATIQANAAIAQIAAARGLPVANIFPDTYRLIVGETVWVGPVNLFPGSDADNNPRYQFTRDGLHPNTCLQSIIARRIIDSFNQAYGTAIPPITDGEILGLTGLNPLQTYLDWAATNSLSAAAPGDDPDQDGIVNLAEFVFGLDPAVANAGPVTIERSSASPVVRYFADPDRQRLVAVDAEWAPTLGAWSPVPSSNLSTSTNGEVTITLPTNEFDRFVRLRVYQKPVD